MTTVIGIASGKGGVGKTTTAINLGTALTNFGKDVVVVDANLSTPHVALHLGSSKLPYSLNDALEGKMHVAGAAYLHPSGLKIIPASLSLSKILETDHKKIKNALLDLSGAADIVLVDVAAGIGKEAMEAIAGCDKLIVVTNPDLPAITDAIRIVALAEEKGCPVIGVVMNRVHGDDFEIELKNAQALIDKAILGSVPEDRAVRKSIALKHPVVYTHPDSPASVAFKKIAAQLLGQEYVHSLSK